MRIYVYIHYYTFQFYQLKDESDMAHSCMHRDVFIHVWHDSFIWGSCPFIWDTTHPFMRHDTFAWVKNVLYFWKHKTRVFKLYIHTSGRVSIIRSKQQWCDMAHSYVYRDDFVRVWHDSFVWESCHVRDMRRCWPIHIWKITHAYSIHI